MRKFNQMDLGQEWNVTIHFRITSAVIRIQRLKFKFKPTQEEFSYIKSL